MAEHFTNTETFKAVVDKNFRDTFIIGKDKREIKGSAVHILVYSSRDSTLGCKVAEWLRAETKESLHILPDAEIDEKEMDDFNEAWLFLNGIPNDTYDRPLSSRLKVAKWALDLEVSHNLLDGILDAITWYKARADWTKASLGEITKGEALMDMLKGVESDVTEHHAEELGEILRLAPPADHFLV